MSGTIRFWVYPNKQCAVIYLKAPMVVWLLLVLVSVAGAQSSLEEARNPFTGDPQAVQEGRQIFVETCSACHGQTGEGGRGPSLIGSREVRRSTDAQLFDSVKNGIPGSDMPPFPFPDDKIWKVLAFVRSLSAPAIGRSVAGDPQAGEELFFGKAGCSNCHKIQGEGGFLGPDLSEIGERRTLAQLREAIFEPSERIADGFESVVLKDGGGREIKAVAKYRTNYSMVVIDAGGRSHMLRGESMARATLKEGSWMPGDYADQLTEAELQNLIAFLSRQSVSGRHGE